jgi:cell division protease FtsH
MSKESWVRTAVIWLAIGALFVLSFKFLYKEQEALSVKYSDFVSAISREVDDPKRMVEVTLRGDTLRGDVFEAKLRDNSTITTYAPYDESLRQELRERLGEQNIPLSYDRPEEGSMWWTGLLTMWLPLILLIVFMFIFLRNMQGAGGKALSFGKSKAKLLPENSQRITFKDVAGVEEAKEECSEIIAFLKDHKRFQEIGARIPKGVLMMGPPGTGKTLLARAIAGEAGVPFFHISGSDFVEMFVGVGASRVRDLFENAKKNAPCIVFIDEIDAVGRHRGAGVGGGHDEREQTLNQLLVEMDGFEANDAVICIAATNRPDVLDPALLRPGRFDRRVVVNLPDVKGRRAILEVYLKKVKAAPGIPVEKLALGTPGFAGADLENLVNEAALLAARKGSKRITLSDFESAKDKILMGPERKSMVMSKETVTITAYHETGHALVAYYLKSKSKVHKVTVIPRGQALGVTSFLPEEDIYNHSKEDILTDIAKAMGGRAAEEIKFGQFTTGASNDIKQATEMARAMVCRYGMSRLGPINFGQKSENPFLGKEIGEHRNFSETVAHAIDVEVSKIINAQYELSKRTLLDHMDSFERVSQILIETETLDADEFEAAVKGASLDDIREIQAEKAKQRNAVDSTSGPSDSADSEEPDEQQHGRGANDGLQAASPA